MRLWPFLAVTLLAAPLAMARPVIADGPPPVPAERLILAADTETRWIPFTLTPHNQIAFDALIGGRPARAVLDTGVSVSVLARRWAEREGLKLASGTLALGVGGDVPLDWVTSPSVVIGGLTREGGRLGVVDLPAGVTGGSTAVDALIGRDMIDRYALDIDFAAHRFRLLPSGHLPFAGATAPLSILPRQQLYVSELRVGDARLRPVLVDTGDGAAITLSDQAWRGLTARPAATSTISYGVSGPVTTDLATLPHAALGDAPLHDVEVRVEPADGFSARIGVAGRIGLGVLQHYRVLLDPLAGRMVLAAEGSAAAPPTRSTSGLLFSIGGDRLRVVHVMRGSPAAAGGWSVGDQICSIDGKAIGRTYADGPEADWPTGTPGRVVALGMCGGGTRSLTLARFY